MRARVFSSQPAVPAGDQPYELVRIIRESSHEPATSDSSARMAEAAGVEQCDSPSSSWNIHGPVKTASLEIRTVLAPAFWAALVQARVASSDSGRMAFAAAWSHAEREAGPQRTTVCGRT